MVNINFENSLLNFPFKFINRIATNQYEAYYHYLDPINLKDVQRNGPLQAESKWNFSFILPVIFIIFVQLYGNLYLVYEAVGHFDLEAMKRVATFYHQIFPRPTWQLIDVVAILANIACCAIYGSFLHHPFTMNRYVPGQAGMLRIGSNGTVK